MESRTKIYIIIILSFIVFLIDSCLNILHAQSSRKARKFYISVSGKDNGTGSIDNPWRTFEPIGKLQLNPGDAIYFQAGNIFRGSFELDLLDTGSAKSPVIISSYGNGKAVIDAGNGNAIRINRSRHVILRNLVIKGRGRKTGNTNRGVFVTNAENVGIDNLEISGFQKSGLEILNCSDIDITNVYAHDNGFAGISVQGDAFPKFTNHRIYIAHCRAENNPGDPTELKNHSGNGIVIGLVTNAVIEFCVATNNGWDMPRKGNGPVGIWAWESDSVIIQKCISYRNRTAPGAMDGGGFDLDGGVTNSIVQYNLTYENEGYGFGIFQYAGATPWHHNTFRYNISYNDGNTTPHGASVLWWNGSKDSTQFHDCLVYNNVFYNSKGYTLGVIPDQYENSNFFFLNNILVAKDEMMTSGKIISENFYGNAWWSIKSSFKMNGHTNFEKWATINNKERLNGKTVGLNIIPEFVNPATPIATDPAMLKKITNFQLAPHAALRNKGLDLKKLFKIDTGNTDFAGNIVPRGSGFEPGAYEMEF